MFTKRRLLVSAVLAIGLVGAGATPSLAQSVVDQTQTVETAGSVNAWCRPVPAPVCGEVGSTFTAGISGKLTSIDVPNGYATTTVDLTVTIWNVDPVYGLPTGTALATQVIPGESLDSGGITSVTFDSPATVTAGTKYVFLLEFPIESASSWPNLSLNLGASPADKRIAFRHALDFGLGINFTTYVEKPAEAPLAETGADDATIFVSVAIATGLFAAGGLAVFYRRNRRSTISR